MTIKRLFFDIETVANPEMVALLPEPKAPATYKDPEKIAAYVAEKKAQQLAEAALDPDTGSVAAIGWMEMGGEDGLESPKSLNRKAPRRKVEPQAEIILPASDAKLSPVNDERCVLSRFWDRFSDNNGNVIGYNLLGFDIPYLMRRSMALGLKLPMIPFMSRYRVEPVTDLYAILYNWGPGKGLKTVCKMYGIPNPLPEVDGSQVAGMDAAMLRQYVCSDVLLTAALFSKMNGIYFSL
jgi:DNA polymerase elongation subunit (family B)